MKHESISTPLLGSSSLRKLPWHIFVVYRRYVSLTPRASVRFPSIVPERSFSPWSTLLVKLSRIPSRPGIPLMMLPNPPRGSLLEPPESLLWSAGVICMRSCPIFEVLSCPVRASQCSLSSVHPRVFRDWALAFISADSPQSNNYYLRCP